MQQHLVTIEQMAVMTEVARTRPALAVHDEQAGFRVLAAKLVESHDARITTKAARQAQGALGMTREYPLQAYTRRLHFWARDFGGGVGLAREMGDLAIETGAFLRFVLDSHADDHAIKEDIAR